MLDELLSIRRRREDDALARVGEAQRELDNQQTAYQAKQRELNDYEVRRQDEMVRLYQTVHQQNVNRIKLESYRQQIGLLRSRKLQLEDELARANQSVGAAHESLAQARRKRNDMHRAVVKFETYQSHLAEMEERGAERREESETEDVVALFKRSADASMPGSVP